MFIASFNNKSFKFTNEWKKYSSRWNCEHVETIFGSADFEEAVYDMCQASGVWNEEEINNFFRYGSLIINKNNILHSI